MKKTISITLHGQIFYVDEDAYQRLQTYLEEIRLHFSKVEDMDVQEIIEDIEASLAEKFAERISSAKQSITLTDVENLITLLGTVADMDADGQPDNNESQEEIKSEEKKARRFGSKLYRNPDDVVIAGVASGLAAYFGIDSVLVRILFLVSIFAGGLGIILYIALWIAMPVAETKAQKLEMQGEPLNLANLSSDSKKKVVEENNGDNLKKRDEQLRSIPGKIGHVFYKIFRVFSFILGMALLTGAWLGMISVLFFSVVAFLDLRLPFFGSTAFFQDLFIGFPYPLIVLSLALTALIPLAFLAQFSVFLFSYKSKVNLWSWFFAMTIWIVAVLVLALAALDIGRSVEEKLINFINEKNEAYEITLDNQVKNSADDLTVYLIRNNNKNLDQLVGQEIKELNSPMELFFDESAIKNVDLTENKIYISEAFMEKWEKAAVPVSGWPLVFVINGVIVDYGMIWPLYSSLLYDGNGLLIAYPFMSDDNGHYLQINFSYFMPEVLNEENHFQERLLRVLSTGAKLEE